MTTLRLRELEEISILQNKEPLVIHSVRPFYKIKHDIQANLLPNTFYINNASVSLATILRLPDLTKYIVGNIIILTHIHTSQRIIFNITGVFPYYIYGMKLQGYTYTISCITGSSYIINIDDEFYIEFGRY